MLTFGPDADHERVIGLDAMDGGRRAPVTAEAGETTPADLRAPALRQRLAAPSR